MLAKSPRATLYTRGFGDFVASITAPIATGCSDSCRVGFAPTEDRRLSRRTEISGLAVDEVIEQAGRSLIETILTKTPGKALGEVCWHGRQKGRLRLADRQLRVERLRLRRNPPVSAPAQGSARSR